MCVFPSEFPCVLFGPWWSAKAKHNDSDDFGVFLFFQPIFPFLEATYLGTTYSLGPAKTLRNAMDHDRWFEKGPRSKIVWVFFETAKLGFFSASPPVSNIWGVYAMYYDYNSRFDLVAWKNKHAFFQQDPWDPWENTSKKVVRGKGWCGFMEREAQKKSSPAHLGWPNTFGWRPSIYINTNIYVCIYTIDYIYVCVHIYIYTSLKWWWKMVFLPWYFKIFF